MSPYNRNIDMNMIELLLYVVVNDHTGNLNLYNDYNVIINKLCNPVLYPYISGLFDYVVNKIKSNNNALNEEERVLYINYLPHFKNLDTTNFYGDNYRFILHLWLYIHH